MEEVAGEVQATKEQFPTKEEMDALENTITKIDAKVVSVSGKLEKEIKLREMSVLAVEDRIVANQEHLDEVEEEIVGMTDQIIDVASIMKEVNEGLASVKDESAKAALAATKKIVEEGTEKVIKSGMEKVRTETKEMISQVTKSVTVLEKRLVEQKEKRVKGDEQLSVLQKKVVALQDQMD